MVTVRSLLLAALLIIGATTARAGEVMDAIHARGTLRIGTTGDYKPFTFREGDGSYRGADIAMAQSLAASLGVKPEFVQTKWSDLLADFTAGKFDVLMGGVSIIPARAEKGTFSRPVLADGKRPVARCQDQDKFTSVAAINQPGVRVIVNPGGSNETFAKANFPSASLTVNKDNVTIPQALLDGQADVLVTDGVEADHWGYIYPGLCPAHVAQPFTKGEMGYLIQRDPALVAAIGGWLDAEIANGEWTRRFDAAQREK